ncbi:MAG: amidohydrolase family protein [bacterium]
MQQALSRREFAVATAMIASKATLNQAQLADDLPIIDTHQHLWDLRRLRLKWIGKGGILDRNYLPDDFAEATAGLGLAQAVYMEVAVVPEDQTAEAKWVSDLCASKSGPTRSAIISGQPGSDGFVKYLDQFKGNPYIKGLRCGVQTEPAKPGKVISTNFMKGIQELGRRNLSFDLNMGGDDLETGLQLVEACPDTRFILDHCGNPDVRQKPSEKWLKGIDRLAGKPNVSAKISGIIARVDKAKPLVPQLMPFVNHVWQAFGPDRVVFGGDWPVCLSGGTYAQWVRALREIASQRSAEDRRKLFHDNALRVYRLDRV